MGSSAGSRGHSPRGLLYSWPGRSGGRLHRKLCEGALTPKSYRELRKQFDSDCAAGGFHWLPFSERLAARVVTIYAALPPAVHLRAAYAVHLGCAAENALKEIYSNDGNLMAAANHFGLTAINII